MYMYAEIILSFTVCASNDDASVPDTVKLHQSGQAKGTAANDAITAAKLEAWVEAQDPSCLWNGFSDKISIVWVNDSRCNCCAFTWHNHNYYC